MAQHLLDAANVGVILDEVCREGMTKSVRRHIFKTALTGVLDYELVDHLTIDRRTRRTNEQIIGLNILLLSADRQVILHPFDRTFSHRHLSGLAAFPGGCEN